MKQLDMKELEEFSGGVAPLLLMVGSSLVGATIGAVVTGWPDFKRGFQEAFWHQQTLAWQQQ
jgi:lactobin A/cerein 7B family class IIb bacteriocin